MCFSIHIILVSVEREQKGMRKFTRKRKRRRIQIGWVGGATRGMRITSRGPDERGKRADKEVNLPTKRKIER